MIVWLSDLWAISPNEVGNKFFNLASAAAWGMAVPEAFCITSTFWDSWAERNHLKTAPTSDLFGNIEKRRRTMSYDFTNEERAQLLAAFTKLGGPEHVLAVRSSASCEDGAQSSLAGYLHSELNIDSFERMLIALKAAYAAFTCLDPKIVAKSRMAVCVQRMVNAEYAGVAFTADPITGERSQTLIELVPGSCEVVVAGRGARLFRVEKATRRAQETGVGVGEALPDTLLSDVAGLAGACEDAFGFPCDIEWAKQAGENSPLALLQIRPITWAVRPRLSAPRRDQATYLVDANNGASEQLVPAIETNVLYQSWRAKKRWITLAAKAGGFNVLKSQWLSYVPGRIEEGDVAELQRALPGEYLFLRYGRERPIQFRVFPADRLENVLNEILPKRLGTEERLVVNVTEWPMSKYQTQSHVCEDGSILLEYSSASFPQLKNGLVKLSRYQLRPDGTVLSHEPGGQCFRTEYDPVTEFEAKIPDPGVPDALEEPWLAELARMTVMMTEKFGRVTVEDLVGHDDRVYYGDLSLANAIVADPDQRVLSPGRVFGRVCRVEEAALEHLLQNYDFSIAGYDNSLSRARQSEQARAMLEKIERTPPPRICVTKYPLPSLSTVVDRFDGFIFEVGSLLCHFGIILREKSIPAVIVDEALTRHPDGDLVDIG